MSEFSLNHPPLICVAARVQFAPVRKIADYIPELQEALRLNGYPLAQAPVMTKNWSIQHSVETGMKVDFEELPRWDFANLEKTVTIRVDQASLTLLFTNYDHFQNAAPHYRQVLDKVEQTIRPLVPQMVQLRYIGYIPYESGTAPTDLVASSVLGMPNLGGLKRQTSISETSFETPEGGQLVTRCMSLNPGNLTLPPDILPLDAKLKYPFQSEKPFLLLENVHQRKAQSESFDAEFCLAELSALRAHNAKLFQATVTQKALELWK